MHHTVPQSRTPRQVVVEPATLAAMCWSSLIEQCAEAAAFTARLPLLDQTFAVGMAERLHHTLECWLRERDSALNRYADTTTDDMAL